MSKLQIIALRNKLLTGNRPVDYKVANTKAARKLNEMKVAPPLGKDYWTGQMLGSYIIS